MQHESWLIALAHFSLLRHPCYAYRGHELKGLDLVISIGSDSSYTTENVPLYLRQLSLEMFYKYKSPNLLLRDVNHFLPPRLPRHGFREVPFEEWTFWKQGCRGNLIFGIGQRQKSKALKINN